MAYVLAGGRGSRLAELTDTRAKPAVYFGGKSRIIDFALSNAINSGIRRIGVATQYKAHSLIRHLQRGWNFFRPERNESFDILPASQRVCETQWYDGTADAVFQNIDIIESYGPEFMVILAGDHIYKMDYELMLQQHCDSGADVTVACMEVPRAEASAASASWRSTQTGRITDFVEKPADPPPMPGKPECRWPRWASMSSTPSSCSRSCGATPPPRLQPRFRQGHHPAIWSSTAKPSPTASPTAACAPTTKPRPIGATSGTVDAYWEANVDLTDVVPQLDLYDRSWPLWTYSEVTPPAKFVHDAEGRRGAAVSSLVSGDCIISGSSLRRSLIFTGVRDAQLLLARRGGGAAALHDRPRRAAVEGGARPGRRDPRGAGGRRGPRARRRAASAARTRASA